VPTTYPTFSQIRTPSVKDSKKTVKDSNKEQKIFFPDESENREGSEKVIVRIKPTPRDKISSGLSQISYSVGGPVKRRHKTANLLSQR